MRKVKSDGEWRCRPPPPSRRASALVWQTQQPLITSRIADFKRQRLQALRADMVQRAAGTLTAAAAEAIRTLLNLLQPLISPAVRLGASRTILEMGIRMRDASDLETRLTTLEQLMTEAIHLTQSNEESP